MTEIHFLNVGHGDCTVIGHASGHITMIDINNGTELDSESAKELYEEFSLSGVARLFAEAFPSYGASELKRKGYEIGITNPVDFMKSRLPGKHIFRYVQTHPDLDHMRGLVGLTNENISITNFWDTEHEKEQEFQSDSDKEEWQEYQRYRSGEKGITVLNIYRGYNNIFYNENPKDIPPGDGLYILSPTPELARKAVLAGNWNNLSYVLYLIYKGYKVIFAGDAEKEVWDDLVSTYGDNLKCNTLKASHHGRDTGYHEEAMKRMSPDCVIVSVGKKPENASNKYKKFAKYVWSTRWRGNIMLSIAEDGQGKLIPEYNR